MSHTSKILSEDKPVGRQALYQMASRHSRKAILRLVELMDSDNENVALGAARTLLDKTLPSLKAIEERPQDGPEKIVLDLMMSDEISKVTDREPLPQEPMPTY